MHIQVFALEVKKNFSGVSSVLVVRTLGFGALTAKGPRVQSRSGKRIPASHGVAKETFRKHLFQSQLFSDVSEKN